MPPLPPTLADAVWSEEAVRALSDASLALLERAGVRVDSPAARDLMLSAGCVPGPQDRLLIPAAAVAAALAACPPRFTLLARDPSRDLELAAEPGPVYVHNMGEAPDIVDPHGREARRATFHDQALAVRVMHHCRYPDSINPLVTPSDVPAELHPLYSFLAIAAETDKHIGGPGLDFAWQADYIAAMADAVLDARPAGSQGGERPTGLDMGFSPVSPLHLGPEVCDGLIAAARRGLAVQILTNPVAGTTAPASMAAALAQQDAEVLAGVVLVQAAAPGTPCSYGARLSCADPRSGRLMRGAGDWSLTSPGATLLARHHGLSCDCYGADTSAKTLDMQAGYQHALPTLVGALGRPRFLSGIGAWTDTGTCLELLVLDDALYGVALATLETPAWDADALDVDAMAEGVLNATSFLGTRHTRRWLRRIQPSEDLSYRGGDEEWASEGAKDVLQLATERVDELVGRGPLGLPAGVEEELCGLIDKAAARAGVGDHPDPRRLLDGLREA